MMNQFFASNGALLKVTVDSLAISPNFSAAEQKIRADAATNLIMAFVPQNAVMTMLASQIIGHHFMLLDTFKKIDTRALTENESIRMRVVSTAQTRVLLSLCQEIRDTRKEHSVMVAADQAARAAQASPPAATAPAQTTPAFTQAVKSAPAAANPNPLHARPYPTRAPKPGQADPVALPAAALQDNRLLESYEQAYAATIAVLEQARALDRPTAIRASAALGPADKTADNASGTGPRIDPSLLNAAQGD